MRFLLTFALLGCGTGDPIGGGADADADTDTDAGPDTGSDLPATGCYDVPMQVVGGFAATGQPFLAAPAAGGVAQLVHGPQGGWHVDTGVHVEATHEIVSATPVITRISDGRVISGIGGDDDANHVTVMLVADGECAGTMVGVRAYFDDIDPDPAVFETLADHVCALSGAEVEVRWDVVDVTDFRTGTASIRAIVALDPADVDDCAAYAAP